MNQSPKKINRRDVLKGLAAAAGAVTFVNLPSRWSKPIVNSGTLPIHAQASNCVSVTVEVFSAETDVSAVIALFNGPLPLSQTDSDVLVSTFSSSHAPPGYLAAWSCMTGCLQLYLSRRPAEQATWRVIVNGPNLFQQDYTDTTHLLIDLETGLLSTTFGSNPPADCNWVTDIGG